ncbi:acyltransferase [Occallatibacter riparius]|uniref:Acyltransferase n=1 Tax=Occallatibacter riparius TaxID=1002689 RepID=A0A9J7BRT4_9BACT|nr:acyltransferase [Occallatibacter riparius]UWZ85289.1 acyltransferase [Occallatibacter riparius]
MLLLNTEFASVGKRVLIRNGARIECIRTPDCADPCLTIGDHTNIEQNVHIICRSRMTIGKRVTITGGCVIVDVNHEYEDVGDPRKIGNRVELVDRPVEIGDDCFIGMHSIILPGVKLGKYCIVGAASVVTRDAPDYSVVAGSPARVVKRYDSGVRKWVEAGTGSLTR